MNDAASIPVLSDALRVILPDEERTQLLRACLLPGRSGQRAWQAWCASVDDPKSAIENDKTGLKGLLPFLHEALGRYNTPDHEPMLTYARAGYLREELRSKAYRDICGRALEALSAAKLPVVALKACVLAETVYKTPASRHCHAVDVLVREHDLTRVTSVLAAQGFVRAKIQPTPGPHHVLLQHPSGLPLELHTRLFYIAHYQLSAGDLWARSRPCVVAGADTLILSPADNLLHVCGHAAGDRTRANLRWACDAWNIIDHHRDLDWQVFRDHAAASGLALPLHVMTKYLAESLEAPIPPDILSALAEAADRADDTAREAALFGALTGLSAAARALFRETVDWRTRARLARFILAPSPACMGWSFRIRHRFMLPLYYLYRPLRYAVPRLYQLIVRPREPSLMNYS